MKNYFDIYIVGVGGQGVLTIADIITLTATRENVDINYYPTKGMAQRGGFVKAQLRIGRAPDTFSPSISQRSADLVVSMELCETLRAIRYAKPDAEYVVLGEKCCPRMSCWDTAHIRKRRLCAARFRRQAVPTATFVRRTCLLMHARTCSCSA